LHAYTSSVYQQNFALGGAVHIQSNIVSAREYLRALWENIVARCVKATWETKSVTEADLKELSRSHNHVIIASGCGVKELWKSSFQTSHRFKYVGGQCLKLNHLESLSRIQVPVLLGCYLVPSFDGRSFYCGSTHEHIVDEIVEQWKPDMNHCMDTLSQQLDMHSLWPSIFPRLVDLRPSELFSGVRVISRRCGAGRIPKAGRHEQLRNIWILSGFGSKGLVHHVVASEFLIAALIQNDETSIPNEMRILQKKRL
jgi:glycine/D-amino acid oxidase-like deaminating enzyme